MIKNKEIMTIEKVKIINKPKPYCIESGENQLFTQIECVKHKKIIQILWNGVPQNECNDYKCIRKTIRQFYKNINLDKKSFFLKNKQKRKRQIKKILNLIYDYDVEYDNNISISLITFLLKLKILKERENNIYEIFTVLKLRKNVNKKIYMYFNILYNNFDAKLVSSCSLCRCEKETEDVFKDTPKIFRTTKVLELLRCCDKEKKISYHIYSRELVNKLNKFQILINIERTEKLINEAYKFNYLKKFNYWSLGIASLLAIVALIISVLTYLKS